MLIQKGLFLGFILENASDYSQDKVQLIPNQFSITSTLPYNVNAKASGSFSGTFTDPLGGPAGPVTFSADLLQLRVRKSGDAYGAKASLSTSDQTVLGNIAPAVNQNFDVEYTLTKTNTLLGEKKTKYTTNVIYTVAYK